MSGELSRVPRMASSSTITMRETKRRKKRNTSPAVSASPCLSIAAMAKVLQTLKRYFKKPWEITGPCASPEYKPSIPRATEYRVPSPATFPIKACVPTSDPETVYDIKYFVRDQRRNRPPVRKTVLRKPDMVKMMKERTGFSPEEFPPVYLTAKVEEDMDTIGGGYQK